MCTFTFKSGCKSGLRKLKKFWERDKPPFQEIFELFPSKNGILMRLTARSATTKVSKFASYFHPGDWERGAMATYRC